MKYFAPVALFGALVAAQEPMVMSAGGTATGAWGPASTSGVTHMIMVGGASLEFTPSFVMANPGDTVRFMFLQKNHSVEQSAFASPCLQMAGGLNSGFKPNANGDMTTAPTFDVPITDTKALWMYCGQTGHCSKGMVFAVNPTQDKSLAAYKQLALATNGTASGTAAAAAVSGAATLAAIQQNPPTQVQSTLTFGTDGGSAATAAVASVATGVGEASNGQTCQCSCLCGGGSFNMASNVAVGSFGGVAGEMPSMIAAMPAAPEASMSTSAGVSLAAAVPSGAATGG